MTNERRNDWERIMFTYLVTVEGRNDIWEKELREGRNVTVGIKKWRKEWYTREGIKRRKEWIMREGMKKKGW